MLKLHHGNYILVTFHRPSNVDTPENLEFLIGFLNALASRIKVVFPIHPRTLNNLREFGLEKRMNSRVILSEPLGYIDFQALTRFARIVVTDSGGIQEETTFLSVQCLTVRDNTERPVTLEVGTNQLCSTNFRKVEEKVNEILNGTTKSGRVPDLWDGNAAERITMKLVESLGQNDRFN
jgi:UDP-N-acetylglucosamine 2-epimerase (non-hydrolysing)